MKCIDGDGEIIYTRSHLTRGAWIEIVWTKCCSKCKISRTSHEVRGLKYFLDPEDHEEKESHLTRGAWIEITGTEYR